MPDSEHDAQPLHGLPSLRRAAAVRICSALRRHPFKGSHRLSRAIPRLLVPPPRHTVRCATLHRFDLVVEPESLRRECIERSIYYQGGYEEGTLDVMRRILRPGDTFVDAGANIGLMAMAAARFTGECGRVLAFEPHPAALAALRRNIAANGIHTIDVIEAALGSRSETATLFDRNAISAGSASLIRQEGSSDSGFVVPVTTLDDALKALEVRTVHMLKIDVEGYELEVLKGARDLLSGQDAPALCFECSTTHPVYGGTLRDLYDSVVSANAYTVWRLEKGKEIPSPLIPVASPGELPAHDNLFGFLPHHKVRVGL